MSEDLKISAELDRMARESGRGSRTASRFNVLHGFNHRLSGTVGLAPNTDSTGLTFFTKPVLNLAYNNINRVRKLEFLGDENPKSMGCAIKCMLSPYIDDRRVPKDTSPSYIREGEFPNSRSAIIDDKQAFIPILSTSLVSLSGWPDKSLDVYTSQEGRAKETMSWVDSRPDIFGSMDLSATFRNMDGDPITTIFDVWTEYAGRVLDGTIVAYPEMRITRSIDYATRIYRFVTDRSRTYVQKMACTGGSFPFAVPNAAAFNQNASDIFNTENDQIAIPFRSSGFLYNDPIIAKMFNQTVEMFNPDMRDANRDKTMLKLTGQMSDLFNWKGYPRIEIDANGNADSYEISWYYYRSNIETILGNL